MDKTADATAPQDKAALRREQDVAEAEWRAIGSLPPHEHQGAAEAWAGKYGHLFYWCCGSPVFGGATAEEYYERSDYYERGSLNGARVYWD